MRTVRAVLAVVGLLVAVVVSGDERRAFPLRGVIASQPKGGLMLRETPPEANAFQYRVGKPLCGVGNGGEFFATEELFVANGEIWFKVLVTRPGTMVAESCPTASFPRTAWMAAKLRDRWVVTIAEQNVALPTPTAVAAATEPPSGASQEPSKPSFLQRFAPLVDTFLLALGTVVAVCVVAIRRARGLKPEAWMSRLVMFDLLIVLVINVTIAFVLSEYVGDSIGLFNTLNALKKVQAGYAVVGFVLSLLLLKFMSFAD